MGCWNGTCMISNLPIIVGDKVKLVFIKPSYSFRELKQCGSYVYSIDAFAPSFLPISATYDDYGSVENIVEDWNYKLIFNDLKKILGDYIIVDGKKIKEYSLYDIIRGIERNDLRYFGVDPIDIRNKSLSESICKDDDDYSKREEWQEYLNIDITLKERKYYMSFVMIREDIWNSIIDNYKGEFWNHNEEEKKSGKYYITAKEWCRYKFDNSFEVREVMGEKFHFNNLFSNTESGNKLITPFSYSDLLSESDKNLRENIYKQWSEFIIINSFLSSARKGWMIQPGGGSQHNGWEEHKILAEKIIEICDKKLKEYEDE